VLKRIEEAYPTCFHVVRRRAGRPKMFRSMVLEVVQEVAVNVRKTHNCYQPFTIGRLKRIVTVVVACRSECWSPYNATKDVRPGFLVLLEYVAMRIRHPLQLKCLRHGVEASHTSFVQRSTRY
jgi:hypothetical protein